MLRIGTLASRFWPFGLLPSRQNDWFLQFHVTACIRFSPPLRRSPSAQSSGTPRTCPRRTRRSWFRRLLSFLTTRLRRVHSRSSLGCSPARVNSRFSSNAHHHGSLPQRLGAGLRPAPESRSRGTFPHLSRSLTYSHGWLVHNELLLRALLQHTLVKKLVPVAPEQELFAHCSAPFEDKAGPGGPLPGEIPGILNICDGYAIYVLRAHRPLSRRLLITSRRVLLPTNSRKSRAREEHFRHPTLRVRRFAARHEQPSSY